MSSVADSRRRGKIGGNGAAGGSIGIMLIWKHRNTNFPAWIREIDADLQTEHSLDGTIWAKGKYYDHVRPETERLLKMPAPLPDDATAAALLAYEEACDRVSQENEEIKVINKNLLEQYAEAKFAQNASRSRMYSLIWNRCSEASKNRVRSQFTNFSAISDAVIKQPLELLWALQETHLMTKSGVKKLDQLSALRKIVNIRMHEHETTYELRDRLISAKRVHDAESREEMKLSDESMAAIFFSALGSRYDDFKCYVLNNSSQGVQDFPKSLDVMYFKVNSYIVPALRGAASTVGKHVFKVEAGSKGKGTHQQQQKAKRPRTRHNNGFTRRQGRLFSPEKLHEQRKGTACKIEGSGSVHNNEHNPIVTTPTTAPTDPAQELPEFETDHAPTEDFSPAEFTIDANDVPASLQAGGGGGAPPRQPSNAEVPTDPFLTARDTAVPEGDVSVSGAELGVHGSAVRVSGVGLSTGEDVSTGVEAGVRPHDVASAIGMEPLQPSMAYSYQLPFDELVPSAVMLVKKLTSGTSGASVSNTSPHVAPAESITNAQDAPASLEAGGDGGAPPQQALQALRGQQAIAQEAVVTSQRLGTLTAAAERYSAWFLARAHMFLPEAWEQAKSAASVLKGLVQETETLVQLQPQTVELVPAAEQYYPEAEQRLEVGGEHVTQLEMVHEEHESEKREQDVQTILSKEAKRKAYASQLPFVESVPSETKLIEKMSQSQKRIFKLLMFTRNTCWLNFECWRDFTGAGAEHSPDDAGSREKMRFKKKDTARMVMLAVHCGRQEGKLESIPSREEGDVGGSKWNWSTGRWIDGSMGHEHHVRFYAYSLPTAAKAMAPFPCHSLEDANEALHQPVPGGDSAVFNEQTVADTEQTVADFASAGALSSNPLESLTATSAATNPLGAGMDMQTVAPNEAIMGGESGVSTTASNSGVVPPPQSAHQKATIKVATEPRATRVSRVVKHVKWFIPCLGYMRNPWAHNLLRTC
jgi:hypothetical protein